MTTAPDAPITYLRADGRVESLASKTYPAGEPLIDCEEVPTRLLVRPRALGDLYAALYWADALAQRGHAVPELILPCVPGARQDRLNPIGDQLFTLRSIARDINARGFPSVTVLDPHSDVTPALIDRCRVVKPAEILSARRAELAPAHWDAMVSPDAGAEKRALGVARAFGLPLLHGWKLRDVATGELTGFGLEPAPAALGIARVLVVDDLCEGGRTFLGLEQQLAERGVSADLYTTHGFYSAGTAELAKRFRRLICTDSVAVRERSGVQVLDVCRSLLTSGGLAC